ncbi:hypothetical protein ACTA71_011696 [Dictyostelium dimigraforme]
MEIVNNNNNNQKTTKNEIQMDVITMKKIIEETPITLLGLINVLRIYDSYKEYELIRLHAVDFFNEYHNNKYFHYFDKKGYIDFILNIFFDSSFQVFSRIRETINSNYFKYKLYKKIINDKRFKDWFKNLYENHRDQLEKRLKLMKNNFSPSSKYNYYYGMYTLYSFVYNGKKVEYGIPSWYFSNPYIDGSRYNRSREIKHYEFSNNSKMKTYKFSDIVIEKMVKDSLFYIAGRMDKVIRNRNILSFALVSKQFFKVLSRILNNGYFEWKKSMINFNNTSEFNLIKQPPLYFDYNSIRLIPYSSSIRYLELLFSRVQSFYIKSDEEDSLTQYYTKRSFKGVLMQKGRFQEDIRSDGYLIYPPPMPSLQSITIDNLFGLTSNYSDLFKHILISNFKTFQSSSSFSIKFPPSPPPPNQGDKDYGIGGLKRFSISIQNDELGTFLSHHIDFLQQALEYHLNSLEKVIINCSGTWRIKENQLESLKSSINCQSKNIIDWSLETQDQMSGTSFLIFSLVLIGAYILS